LEETVRSLFTIFSLFLVLGTSRLAADDSYWKGAFEGDLTGIWNGTIHDNPDEDQVPHFSGNWYFIDIAEHGTLFGVYSSPQPGYYMVSAGVIYDEQGTNIGSWEGFFDLGYDGTPGSHAEGTWVLADGSASGNWKGDSP
jgi:hypothetical protein